MRRIVSLGSSMVKAVGLAIILTVGACGWWDTEGQLVTHARLLESMAAKGRDLAVRDMLTPESLAELLYPLSRAEAFASQRRPEEPSDAGEVWRDFDTLMQRYRGLCDAVDRGRREHASGVPAMELDAQVAGIREKARAVRVALGRPD